MKKFALLKMWPIFAKFDQSSAVVVVKWSAYLPSTPLIQARILLKYLKMCKILLEKIENKHRGNRIKVDKDGKYLFT